VAGAITLVSNSISTSAVNLSTTTGSSGQALADYAVLANTGGSNTPNIRRSGGGSLISVITATGTSPNYFDDGERAFTTTDATPSNITSESIGTFWDFTSTTPRLVFTVPAGTGSRQLRLYSALYSQTFRLTAVLSDASASPLVVDYGPVSYDTFLGIIDFNANISGQTLTVTIEALDIFAVGNYAISAIWLSVETGGAGNTYNVSITETFTSTESSNSASVRLGAITESITATESSSALGVLTRSITESITATEAQSARAVFNGLITEPVSLVDSPSARLTIPAAITEAVSLTEQSSSSIGGSSYNSSITESISSADASSSILTALSSVTESITLNNTQSSSALLLAQINEAITANATHGASMQVIGSISEAMALVDASSSRFTGSSSVSEPIALLDNPNAGLVRAASITESVTATESSASTMVQVYNVSITEAISLIDQASVSVIKKLAKRVIGGAISLREGVGNLIRRNIGSDLTERDE